MKVEEFIISCIENKIRYLTTGINLYEDNARMLREFIDSIYYFESNGINIHTGGFYCTYIVFKYNKLNYSIEYWNDNNGEYFTIRKMTIKDVN